jgi:spore coat polysaccharide biosynthesis protein SpsF
VKEEWKDGVAIVIQARLSSTRLPLKSLLPIYGSPLFALVTSSCSLVGVPIILAVPESDIDIFHSFWENSPLISSTSFLFGGTGDVNDVLQRFSDAIEVYESDFKTKLHTIVRVTADCPFVSSDLIVSMLKFWYSFKENNDVVMLSNVYPVRTFAKGLDIEIVDRDFLVGLNKNKDLMRQEREHVTLGIYNRYSTLVSGYVNDGTYEEPDLNLCIDTYNDYVRIFRMIHEEVVIEGGCN